MHENSYIDIGAFQVYYYYKFIIIKVQFEKDRHTLLCILKLLKNIVYELSLKNAWLRPILLLGFQ